MLDLGFSCAVARHGVAGTTIIVISIISIIIISIIISIDNIRDCCRFFRT